jgi:hypothetical protein
MGTLLREMGVLDDSELERSVREHLQEIVQDSVTWCDGEWLFEPGALPTAETITLEVAVAALVAEGIRRIRSWTRVLAGCGGLDQPIALTPNYLAALDAMGAGVDEWRIVTALREPQTARRVCRMLETSELETCRLIWPLVVLGAVEPREAEIIGEAAGAATTPLSREAIAAALRSAPRAMPEDGTADAAWEPPGDLDLAIARFNEVHRVVWRTLRMEVGAGAANFVRSCCAPDGPGALDPVGETILQADGTWSPEGLREVARRARLADPWQAYRRVVEMEIARLRDHVGAESAARLERQLGELARGAGAPAEPS